VGPSDDHGDVDRFPLAREFGSVRLLQDPEEGADG
jgi:hypothetical protein